MIYEDHEKIRVTCIQNMKKKQNIQNNIEMSLFINIVSKYFECEKKSEANFCFFLDNFVSIRFVLSIVFFVCTCFYGLLGNFCIHPW